MLWKRKHYSKPITTVICGSVLPKARGWTSASCCSAAEVALINASIIGQGFSIIVLELCFRFTRYHQNQLTVFTDLLGFNMQAVITSTTDFCNNVHKSVTGHPPVRQCRSLVSITALSADCSGPLHKWTNSKGIRTNKLNEKGQEQKALSSRPVTDLRGGGDSEVLGTTTKSPLTGKRVRAEIISNKGIV